jgi:hypothetical protein
MPGRSLEFRFEHLAGSGKIGRHGHHDLLGMSLA